MDPDLKFDYISELAEEYDTCTRCRLCEPVGRDRVSVVSGEGNPDASVMIVGEAPGRDEDHTGLPFQGRKGTLLNKMLSTFGVDRDEVFLTNVVACRPTEDDTPGQNRKPEKDEIAACRDRLHRTIEIVDPLVILLLGSTALSALADTSKKITSIARNPYMDRLDIVTEGRFGKVTRVGYATWHPSYLLRNESQEAGGDLHMALKTFQKAFRVADRFRNVYWGDIIPPRGEEP